LPRPAQSSRKAHPEPAAKAHECFPWWLRRPFSIFAISKAVLFADKNAICSSPEVIWNIEEGLKLTVRTASSAPRSAARCDGRGAHLSSFQDIRSAAGAGGPSFAPFPDREHRYCRRNGRRAKKFDQLCRVARHPSYSDHAGGAGPALSLPCGFTASGLPVGLQMVAGTFGGEAPAFPRRRESSGRQFWGVRGTTGRSNPRVPKTSIRPS